MKIFMLGWEFPPFISGGLGTACFGLTKAMNERGLEVMFVLPKPIEANHSTHVQMLSPRQCRSVSVAGQPGDPVVTTHLEASDIEREFSNVTFHSIPSALQPYMSPEYYQKRIEEIVRERVTEQKYRHESQGRAVI